MYILKLKKAFGTGGNMRLRIRSMVPLGMVSGCRTKEVSLVARASNLLFGAPNARRANGIISSSFDLFGLFRLAFEKLTGKRRDVPVFAIDRMGTEFNESLPRIWLSERMFNTKNDGSGRVFVESYPTGPDRGGVIALELGDRYLGEGLRGLGEVDDLERKECLKAAEILYLHAIRRGNRIAASRLRRMYAEDLCDGDYWVTHLEGRARHAKRKRLSSGYPHSRYKIYRYAI